MRTGNDMTVRSTGRASRKQREEEPMDTDEGAPGPALQAPDIDASLLSELVAYLREHRPELLEEWVKRIADAQLLRVMSSEEVFTETTAVYDNYVDALETGSVETR